jgi:hypothetical protein
MLSSKNIPNLEPVDLPAVKDKEGDVRLYRIYSDEKVVRNVCNLLEYKYKPTEDNAEGFKETSLNAKASVVSIGDAVKKVNTGYGGKDKKGNRTYYPCYLDIKDKASLRFVVIIRPDTDKTKLEECDRKYMSLVL